MVGWRNGRDKFKPSIAHFEENPLDGGQLSSTSTFFLIFFACATHVAQLFHLYKTWKGKIQGSSNVTLNGETRFDSSKILSLKSNSSACIAVYAKLYPNPIDDLNLLDFHGPSSYLSHPLRYCEIITYKIVTIKIDSIPFLNFQTSVETRDRIASNTCSFLSLLFPETKKLFRSEENCKTEREREREEY